MILTLLMTAQINTDFVNHPVLLTTEPPTSLVRVGTDACLNNMNVHSSYQTSFSTTLPIGKWSPGSMSSSSSSFNYQTLSNEVTESDSSSTSERIMDSDITLKSDVPEQESCDIKHIL
ncbi:homeobox domain-containing protein [Trichonephila clavipes]|nr:homeobox domain-containing protein [Trichonephila clavipes]